MKPTTELTHAELLPHGADYLSRVMECGPCVLVEPAKRFGLTGPIPDCFGFRDATNTFDIDCKTSASDARAHMEKEHVLDIEKGPGRFRYLLCHEYLIEGHESWLPEWMGVLWLGSEGVYERREAQPIHKRNLLMELGLALTAWKGNAWREMAPAKSESGRAAKLSKEQHAEIRNVLADYGQAGTLELARAIATKGKRAGTVAKWIADDAAAGLIEGVSCAGSPAVLWLEGAK